MKRRWFQIHLSTAVVLMFESGLLIWANTGFEHDARDWVYPDTNRSGRIADIGFPFPFFTRTNLSEVNEKHEVVPVREFNANFKQKALFMNAAICFLLLLFTIVIVEYLGSAPKRFEGGCAARTKRSEEAARAVSPE